MFELIIATVTSGGKIAGFLLTFGIALTTIVFVIEEIQKRKK